MYNKGQNNNLDLNIVKGQKLLSVLVSVLKFEERIILET